MASWRECSWLVALQLRHALRLEKGQHGKSKVEIASLGIWILKSRTFFESPRFDKVLTRPNDIARIDSDEKWRELTIPRIPSRVAQANKRLRRLYDRELR
jgi:hypothetical protein